MAPPNGYHKPLSGNHYQFLYPPRLSGGIYYKLVTYQSRNLFLVALTGFVEEALKV